MKIPFTPVIYEHAARFVGRTPWEVSRDPELMFEGHRRAYLEYHHQVIAVGIDIYNLEAEAYGAKIAAAGLDVAFFESAAAPPILSPRQFHELELPALKRILAVAADCIGHPVPCIMGGNTYPILADILATGTNYLVCNVETDQAAFVEAVARLAPQVKIRVNLDPGVVACRDPQRIYRSIDRVLEIVGGRANCLMGTGAMPLETPPENIRLIREYLKN